MSALPVERRRWIRFLLPSALRKVEHELACERETVVELRAMLTRAQREIALQELDLKRLEHELDELAP